MEIRGLEPGGSSKRPETPSSGSVSRPVLTFTDGEHQVSKRGENFTSAGKKKDGLVAVRRSFPHTDLANAKLTASDM